MKCPKCISKESVKSGIIKGKQRYKCKECGCNYTVKYKINSQTSISKKASLASIS
jgi:transposase-like protein